MQHIKRWLWIIGIVYLGMGMFLHGTVQAADWRQQYPEITLPSRQLFDLVEGRGPRALLGAAQRDMRSEGPEFRLEAELRRDATKYSLYVDVNHISWSKSNVLSM